MVSRAKDKGYRKYETLAPNNELWRANILLMNNEENIKKRIFLHRHVVSSMIEKHGDVFRVKITFIHIVMISKYQLGHHFYLHS